MTRRVRVKNLMPPGHVRTPSYCRGKTGIVERSLGMSDNPEQLAYGLPPARRELLRVQFRMEEIWGPECENPGDTLELEIFSHWLEPAEGENHGA